MTSRVIRLPVHTDIATAFFSRFSSFAPKHWEISTENPWATPVIPPMAVKLSQSDVPRAARASTPTPLPTITLSITVYSCWNTFPSMRGRAKETIIPAGFPLVISLVFCFITISPCISVQPAGPARQSVACRLSECIFRHTKVQPSAPLFRCARYKKRTACSDVLYHFYRLCGRYYSLLFSKTDHIPGCFFQYTGDNTAVQFAAVIRIYGDYFFHSKAVYCFQVLIFQNNVFQDPVSLKASHV